MAQQVVAGRRVIVQRAQHHPQAGAGAGESGEEGLGFGAVRAALLNEDLEHRLLGPRPALPGGQGHGHQQQEQLDEPQQRCIQMANRHW